MMAIMAKRRIQKVRQTRRCEPLFFRTVLACQDSGLERRGISGAFGDDGRTGESGEGQRMEEEKRLTFEVLVLLLRLSGLLC